MTALPKAIQKQIDEAEAIEKALNQPDAPADNAPENTENNQKEAESTPEQTKVENTNENANQEHVEPVDNYKAKYDVLEGKYRSEVPRLAAELRDAKAQMASMKEAMDALNAKANEPPVKKEDPLVTDKDRDAFGEDLVDFTKRAAKDVVAESIAAFADRLKALERAVASVAELPKKVVEVAEKQAITEGQAFWRDLESRVPDWKEVDKDPRWIAHLDSKAKYVQGTYRQIAELAVAESNVEAIVEMVEDWKVLVGFSTQQNKQSVKKELEKQITPNKQSSGPTTPSEPKTYTWDEYNAAYDPRASRTMSPAEVAAYQAELETAYLEGRIV